MLTPGERRAALRGGGDARGRAGGAVVCVVFLMCVNSTATASRTPPAAPAARDEGDDSSPDERAVMSGRPAGRGSLSFGGTAEIIRHRTNSHRESSPIQQRINTAK